MAETTADYVVLLVAHVLPWSHLWLAQGLRHFSRPEVAGVYSFNKAFWRPSLEWLVLTIGWLRCRLRGVQYQRSARYGTLGFTNAIIRRSLWERHPFDESYGAGGEDGAWARTVLAEGYVVVRDPGFGVRHSHDLTWRQFLDQTRRYAALRPGQAFMAGQAPHIK